MFVKQTDIARRAGRPAAAEPAVAADRFARKIVGFLKDESAARLRQLNGRPLCGRALLPLSV
jgi:hypothetical protein